MLLLQENGGGGERPSAGGAEPSVLVRLARVDSGSESAATEPSTPPTPTRGRGTSPVFDWGVPIQTMGVHGVRRASPERVAGAGAVAAILSRCPGGVSGDRSPPLAGLPGDEEANDLVSPEAQGDVGKSPPRASEGHAAAKRRLLSEDEPDDQHDQRDADAAGSQERPEGDGRRGVVRRLFSDGCVEGESDGLPPVRQDSPGGGRRTARQRLAWDLVCPESVVVLGNYRRREKQGRLGVRLEDGE